MIDVPRHANYVAYCLRKSGWDIESQTAPDPDLPSDGEPEIFWYLIPRRRKAVPK